VLTNINLLEKSFGSEQEKLYSDDEKIQKIPRYALKEYAKTYLVSSSPFYYGNLIILDFSEHYPTPSSILESLQKYGTHVYGGSDPWEKHEIEKGLC